MYHMKTVTVRDLRYDFPKVELMLRQGESVQVSKRGKVVAMLAPPPAPAVQPRPDFLARLREIYGDTILEVPGSEIVRQDRDRY